MSKSRHVESSRAIGRTLKDWREEQGYSLGRVSRESQKFSEPIGLDYLSRLERGHLMPSVPKLATLAAVFGRPISELIDLYEIEELRRLVPKDCGYHVCRKLGIEHLDKGETTHALACFLGALDAAKRENASRQTLAVAHNNVGHAMLRGGRYLTARRYLETGLLFVENALTRARLLDNLANVHYQLEDLILADVCARASYDLAADDPVLGPAAAATRAAVLFDLGQLSEAEVLLRMALEAAERLGDERLGIRRQYNLGYCLMHQGKPREGLSLLQSAADRAAGRPIDPYLKATSVMFLGRGLYTAGQRGDARSRLEQSLALSLEDCNRNVAFHSAFYLWRIARDEGNRLDESRYEMTAREQRVRMEQRSGEAREFDAWLTAERPRVFRSVGIGRSASRIASQGPVR